jgi:hypothetical protein
MVVLMVEVSAGSMISVAPVTVPRGALFHKTEVSVISLMKWMPPMIVLLITLKLLATAAGGLYVCLDLSDGDDP